MRPIRVLFDLDDTLTDFIHELVDRYNKKYETEHTIDECNQWNLNEIFEHNILELIDDEDFFESVKPKERVVELMEKWTRDDRYEIYIVTSCLKPINYMKKVKWFERHMPFFPVGRVIPITNKEIIQGDILVDDNPNNLRKWQEENCDGFCLMMNAPHNQSCDEFFRIERFEQIESILGEFAIFGSDLVFTLSKNI